MSKIKNVVIVNDFDYVQGGASKVAIDTADILYEKGFNVIFFSAVSKKKNYKFKQISTNQNECLKDGIRGALRGIYNYKVEVEFSKLLDSLDNKETIIHIHGWTKALSSIIFKVAYKKNFKVVLTLHDYFTVCPNGGLFNYKKNKICNKKPMCFKCFMCNCDSRNYLFKIYRLIRQKVQNKNIKHLNNVITISDFSEKILKRYLDNVNKNINYYRVYNPIDINKEKCIDVSKNKYYLYVGRVTKEKGTDLFCKALTDLKLHGIVVGDGPMLSQLKKEYNNKYITFTGWQDKESVKKYMQNAKALIFPSRWYETAGLTVLEAQAIGLPSLVSSCCATTDFINKDNGIIFSNNLYYTIKKYEKSDCKKSGIATYINYWNNPYDLKKYENSLINIYKKIK